LTRTIHEWRTQTDAVDIPIVCLDHTLGIRHFNAAAARLLNLNQTAAGQPISRALPAFQRIGWQELVSEALCGGPIEREVQTTEGRTFSLRIRPWPEESRELITLAFVDRTALRESRFQLSLVKEAGGIGIWKWELGEEIQCSEQCAVLHGFPPQCRRIRFKQWIKRMHPADRPGVHDGLRQVLRGSAAYEAEYRVMWPDGTLHWLHGTARLIRGPEDRPVRWYGAVIDITERKRLEQERLTLSRELAKAQEEERRKLARELHDNLTQRLATLAMELDLSAERPPRSRSAMRRQFRSLLDQAVQAAEVARHLAYKLYPSEVQDLGLERSLRAHCHQVESQTEIRIKCTLSNLPDDIPREIAACLYNVVRECLSNIVKHAHALTASVALTESRKRLILSISDDGAGFDPHSISSAAGLGLRTMKERLAVLNGTFSLRSRPGAGTRIRAGIPLLSDPQ
jgi:signal transduction histidine kinase